MEQAADTETIRGWFAGRVPSGWYAQPPEVRGDRDEILVIGTLSQPRLPEGATAEAAAAAFESRIEAFREKTRGERIRIARDAERRFRRKVSWGARCGEAEKLFTTLSVPAMTRLRLPERAVLDTLVDAGVARSRSHALAWCVRLVAEHQEEWLRDLRQVLVQVEKVREKGPIPGR